MRHHELSESKTKISDAERGDLIEFIIQWIGGTYMSQSPRDPLVMWQRIHELFPTRISSPKRLMRLVTLPIEYADMKTFRLDRPAPKDVGSWTSTYFGLDSVHGVATEFNDNADTCRIAIRAKIDPRNILASYETLKRAYLSLTHDYNYDDYEVNTQEKRGNITVHNTRYKSYLGRDDSSFHDDLGYYQGIFRDVLGGPLRQYEYIVKTTPLDVENIKVFRKGNEMYRDGHDDPHNSGNYRGWSY